MPKVEAKIGFTLKIRKDSQYEFIRPEIGISDIDSDEDVEKQLELAEKALKETWNKITDLASEEILSHLGEIDQELQMQIAKKFKKLDVAIEELKLKLSEKIGGQ